MWAAVESAFLQKTDQWKEHTFKDELLAALFLRCVGDPRREFINGVRCPQPLVRGKLDVEPHHRFRADVKDVSNCVRHREARNILLREPKIGSHSSAMVGIGNDPICNLLFICFCGWSVL